MMKTDLGMEDSTCFTPIALVPSLKDVTATLSATWTAIVNAVAEVHAEVSIVDRTTSYSTVTLVRNTDYYKLPGAECPMVSRVPQLREVGRRIGEEISVAGSVAGLCMGMEAKGWDTYGIVDGSIMPSGVTWDGLKQTFSGKISTPGIFTIEMKSNS